MEVCFLGYFGQKKTKKEKALSTWNYPRDNKLHPVLPRELTLHDLTQSIVIER